MNINTKKQDAHKIIRILEKEGYETRLVGGCIRDELLGLTPGDYDLATVAKPIEILNIFRASGTKTLTFGQEHGTISVVLPSGVFEITTLRADVKTYGRSADVEFKTDFREDALRRDFTINAMSQDINGKIYDYFNGKEHLKSKLLLFVGEAENRIKEDYLRILRYFRFKSRFGFTSDKTTLKAIEKNVDGLKNISAERITYEIKLILSYQDYFNSFKEMLRTKVIETLFSSKPVVLSNFEKTDLSKLNIESRSLIRLACHFNLSNTKSISLTLSNEEQKYLKALYKAKKKVEEVSTKDLADHLLMVEDCEKLCKSSFEEGVYPYLLMAYENDVSKINKINIILENETKFGKRRESFPLKAEHLMAELSLKPGPIIGNILSKLYRKYLSGEWEKVEEAIVIVKKELLK